ncbi:MAG: hypothetical protein DMD39_10470 [Gemmatimonadetes bacterium]|nr:MAG: hypothetical protein DMD39_10470 [Gemmatimonadota bacterium]
MRIQRIAIALTVINLLILITAMSRIGSAATTQTVPMLRGRGLEIVDDRGKVRAQIIVLPVDTAAKTARGQNYPETVLFRLIDPNGRPGVKIGTSVDGSGMSLAGDSERRDWNGVQILAESAGTSVKLTNKNGRKQIITP